MHLRQLWFMQRACGAFTKSNKRIQKLKGTGDSRYIYQNKLDRGCFECKNYWDFKDLPRGTVSDKVLHSILLKIDKMIDININVLQWFTDFLISAVTRAWSEALAMWDKTAINS